MSKTLTPKQRLEQTGFSLDDLHTLRQTYFHQSIPLNGHSLDSESFVRRGGRTLLNCCERGVYVKGDQESISPVLSVKEFQELTTPTSTNKLPEGFTADDVKTLNTSTFKTSHVPDENFWMLAPDANVGSLRTAPEENPKTDEVYPHVRPKAMMCIIERPGHGQLGVDHKGNIFHMGAEPGQEKGKRATLVFYEEYDNSQTSRFLGKNGKTIRTGMGDDEGVLRIRR